MERRKNNAMMRFSAIVLCMSAILLLTAPVLCADETVPVGPPVDIDYPVTGILWIYGTANLLTGASVTESIYVQDGGTLNMYSGSVGWFVNIATSNVNVTVYGTGFGGDGDFSVPGQVTFTSGSGTLTGVYEDGSDIDLFFYSDIPIYLEAPGTTDEQVEIDIKPCSYPNSINLKSKGVVPVAVLRTEDFDAETVNPTTVEFAGASPLRWKMCDVDNDGDEDILFHFKTQELALDDSSTEATLTGQTTGGSDISGTDDVRIVSSKSKNKKKK